MRQKKKLICIIGIDGSGKTTQAKRLLEHFRQLGTNAVYVHCYHRPILLKPFKILAKMTVMRGTHEFSDYKQYRMQKSSVSKRHRFFTTIYGLIWILDYWIQTFLQIQFSMWSGNVVIIDRYIYDTALNMSLSLNLPIESAYRLINLFLKFNAKPTHFFLIDLPEDIAHSRKNDIQSIDYLKERRERYLQIAKQYGAIIMDGTLEPESLQNQILLHIKRYDGKSS